MRVPSVERLKRCLTYSRIICGPIYAEDVRTETSLISLVLD